MCYSKPGPRCSAHVKQQLAEAERRKMLYLEADNWDAAGGMLSRISEIRQEWYGTPDGIRHLRENGEFEAAETFAKERKKAIEAWKKENESGPSNLRHLDVEAGRPFMKDFTIMAIDTQTVPNGKKVSAKDAETAIPVGGSVTIDGTVWNNEGGGKWSNPYMTLGTEELFEESNDGVGYQKSENSYQGTHLEHNLILRTNEGREVHATVSSEGGNDRWVYGVRTGQELKMTGVVQHHVFTEDENYTEANYIRPYRPEPSETMLAG